MKDKLIGRRYQVVKTLASGGFGQTYIAEDTQRPGNPQCVVKHLLPASSNLNCLQNARRMFQCEAETLEKLGNHDQIPRLLAYFEENQEFYLVQDFIPGHLLKTELQPGYRWTETRVCQLLQDILSILVFVHSQGVIHRDIKPSNLIGRQQDGKLVLIDFGSVKQAWTQVVDAPEKTCTTLVIGIPATIAIGTPGYMPVEQQRGRPRPSSDIYAVGMIGIQALTGLNPTQLLESDTGDIIWQHQAHVSHALASILTKMVRYHFEDRYQTVREALQAIQLLLNTQPHTLDSVLETSLVQQPSTSQPILLFPQSSQDQFGQNIIPVVANPHTTPLISTPYYPLPSFHATPLNFEPTEVDSQLLDAHEIKFSTSVEGVLSGAGEPRKTSFVMYKSNQNHLLIWTRITAVIICMVLGYAVYWQVRPRTEETLEKIQTLMAQGEYKECVKQATTVPKNSRFYNYAQALLNECQLTQAAIKAAEHNFKEAITEAGKIPQDAAYYQDAQQLINQWSKSIFEIATNKYQLGSLNDAIAITKDIPETSPVYQMAQGEIKLWHKEWEKNISYLIAAYSALDRGKWQNAIGEAKKITDTPYWQERIKPVIQKAESKIAESKTVVISQPTSTIRQSIPTTPRRLRRATRQLIPTTPRRLRRATRQSIPTTPRRLRRATRQSIPTTPRRLRRAIKQSTRITPRQLRRIPSKPSYTWTTKTVP